MADATQNTSGDIKPGEPSKIKKEYVEIIESNVDDLDEKFFKETGEPTAIMYYCTECKKVLQNPKRIGKKLKFSCPDCKGKKVCFGTKKSLMSHFRIHEEDLSTAQT